MEQIRVPIAEVADLIERRLAEEWAPPAGRV
jgi:hypothetical protein